MKDNNRPLLVIVGPTASGKSSLAIDLAKSFDGEIICADSRTIYKDMNIGTAKPTSEDRKRTRHWGLDLVAPGERFTAFEFKQYANQKINDIRARGKTPMLVGGTGLYINSVIFDYQFDKVDESARQKQLKVRKELEQLSVEDLQLKLINQGYPLPKNLRNKRHLIQSILRQGREMKSAPRPIPNTYIAGLTVEDNIIQQRIMSRIKNMFEHGLVDETASLAKKYGWENEAMTGNIYPVVRKMIDNEITQKEAIEQASKIDWQLVRRQRTWFKRNQYINWFNPEVAYDNLVQVLDTFSEA